MLQQPRKIGWAWRVPARKRVRERKSYRLSPSQLRSYVRYIEGSDPGDRVDREMLDDLRTDGHVWSDCFICGYGGQPVVSQQPRSRIWTDEEEKELHRQEDAAARERYENRLEFMVVKQRNVGT